MLQWLNLHDSCGVNNLHGMPGLFAAFFSVLVCGLAPEDVYGPRLASWVPEINKRAFTT